VHLEGVAIWLDELPEGPLITRLRGRQQPALIHDVVSLAHRCSPRLTVAAAETHRLMGSTHEGIR
jgi:hypothetical protein